MPKMIPEQLTRREREIMNALSSLGNRASAEDIRARLTSPPGDSSVRVMLARLERKGYLKHQQDGVRYISHPRRRRAPLSGRHCTSTSIGPLRNERFRPLGAPTERS